MYIDKVRGIRLFASPRADVALPGTLWQSVGLAASLWLLAVVQRGFALLTFLDAEAVVRPAQALSLVVIIVSTDLSVALGAGLVHFALSWMARERWQRNAALALALLLAVAVLSLYVVSIPFFDLYRTPLRFTQLLLVGSLGNITESAGAVLQPSYVLFGILVVSCGVVAIPWVGYYTTQWLNQLFVRIRGWLLLLMLVLTCGLAIVTASLSFRYAGELKWLAANPAYVFGQSMMRWAFAPEHAVSLENPPHFPADPMFGRRVPQDSLPELVNIAELPVRRDNVVLIIVESASVNRFGLWKGARDTTPNLKQLSNTGLIFDNYYSPVPVSMKSLLSVSCSTYPHTHPRAETYTNPRIDCMSLSEVLTRHGYQAALFHAGHFEYTHKDRFFSDRGYSVMRDAGDLTNKAEYRINGWGIDDRAMFDDAIEWLDQAKDHQPFFLTLITLSPHHPYTLNKELPTPFGTRTLQDKYDNAVHLIDSQIGRVWDALKAHDLQDDTLIVVVGDHGEALGEHAGHFVHGSLLYEEAIKTPMMLVHPKLFDGARTARVGSHVDLAPTILDIVGVGRPPRYQGQSLLRNYRPKMVYFYANWSHHRLALRDGRWKYIYAPDEGRHELYDLQRDPRERRNLARHRKDRVSKYQQRVTQWQDYYAELIPNYERYVTAAQLCPGQPVCALTAIEPTYVHGRWIKQRNARGGPLRIGRRGFVDGIGVRPLSVLRYSIAGGDFRFLRGAVGHDSWVVKTQVTDQFAVDIYVDEKLAWTSGKINIKSPAKDFEVPLNGARTIEFVSYDVDGNAQDDLINWVDVRLER